MKVPQLIFGASADVQQLQDNVIGALRELSKDPFLEFNVVENVTLTTTPKPVVHGLKKPIQGWVVTRQFSPTFYSGLYELKAQSLPERHVWMATAGGEFTGSIRFW